MHRLIYRGLAVLLATLALSAITACGQKGPLFKPSEPASTPTVKETPADEQLDEPLNEQAELEEE